MFVFFMFDLDSLSCIDGSMYRMNDGVYLRHQRSGSWVTSCRISKAFCPQYT